VNLKEMLEKSVARRGHATCLRFKRNQAWQTISYAQFLARVRTVAEILGSGFGIKPGDRVGLYRENSPEWPELYFGIVCAGATAVPVDAKLQEQEVAHILRDSGARALFAGGKNYALLRDVEPHLPDLEHVALVEGRELMPIAARKVRYGAYEELYGQHRAAADSAHAVFLARHPQAEDIASLIYTSGTTGRQKGAMLTHRNFAANVESCCKAIEIRSDDNFLLVLPLHHAFAFTTCLLLPVAVGAEISLVENLKTVGENMREVSPTLLLGVPLLLEKMYNRIMAGLRENKAGYAMFRLGLRKPVIKAIAQKLGGRLRIVISGGAPCDPELLVRYTELGIKIMEGYGLTETAPVVSLNPYERPRPGTVGLPLPDVEVCIADADADGVGEIVIRGPNVMRGYYNQPEATAAVFRDGWFLTGDLGFIDADGYITITGRKKSLIVNREGKNIYPEEVEHQICRSPFIREALALGYRENGEKVGEHVGLIVVPDQEYMDAWMVQEKRRLTEKEMDELIRREVRVQAARIAEYKRPRRIQIRWEEFSKTSTGKIKRYLYSMSGDDVE